MGIKNVVFDVGNVLVRWDPRLIIATAFPEHPEQEILFQGIFKHQTWYDLNLGLITEQQALQNYQQRLNLESKRLERLADIIKESLVPVEGSHELLRSLYDAHYPLFALTDNTPEIMAYLRKKYDFWSLFQGVVVSAEIGHLKPKPPIYHHLLTSFDLVAQETVFIDDLLANVEGARTLGMQGIQFKDADQCRAELLQMELRF